MATFTLTGDLPNMIGLPLPARALSAHIQSNASGGVLVVGDKIHLGGVKLPLQADGTFSLAGIPAVDGISYQVTASFVDPGTGKPRTKGLGWWESPAADAVVDLADLVTSDAMPIPEAAVIAQLLEARDETLAARDDAIQAETDTATHAAAVQAVVATNDGIMTTVAQDSGSAFSGELAATYVGAITPQKHGAVGDGSTDDTDAFVDAIAEQASTGRPIYIPEGRYLVTSSLTVNHNAAVIYGAGKDVSIIDYQGSGYALGSNAPAGNLARWKFADFTIDSRDAAADTIGLHLDNVGRSRFDNLRLRCTVIAGGGVGMLLIGGETGADKSTYWNDFYNMENAASGVCVKFSGYANSNRWTYGLMEGGDDSTSLFVEEGGTSNNIGTNLFTGVGFQTKGTEMMVLGKASGSVSNVNNFQFIACRYEAFHPQTITMHPNTTATMFVGGTADADITFVDNGTFNTILMPYSSKFRIGGNGKTAVELPYPTAGITIGGDALTNLYRRVAGSLKTDGDLDIGGVNLRVAQGGVAGTTINGSSILAAGSNASIPLNLVSKGTSAVRINVTGTATGGTQIEKADGRIGFFGVTTVTKPTALTTADASAVNSGDATTDTVIDNLRTRINELETKFQALGLLP